MALLLSMKAACDYDRGTTTHHHSAKEERYIEQKDTNFGLPPGFPLHLNSKLAWSGSQLSSDQFIYYLTETDKLEIEKALVSFKELGIDGDLVDCYNFPLPNLQLVLRFLSRELHNGKGFFLLRGLDYEKYSVEDNTIIFLGVQSFIAEKRARQDHLGNMIGVHIIADSTSSSPPFREFHTRHSSSKIAFHTDNIGDILAFQTRSTASRGGNAIVSSAYAIYNELATTRPDIIRTLAGPDWPIACPFYHERPILFYHASHIIFNFFNGALLGSKAHPRPVDLTPVAPHQVEALDVLQTLAEKHRLEIELQVGDMHFVNNLAVLHRRDAFEIDPGSKRHLVRMWLRSEAHAWDLPAILNDECGWAEAFKENEDMEEVWHIEPMPHFFFPLRKYGN